jgi:hypothetical protein
MNNLMNFIFVYTMKTLKLFSILLALLSLVSACEDRTQTLNQVNPDITRLITGNFEGLMNVRNSANPSENSSQLLDVSITKISDRSIRVNASGGDVFECTIRGAANNPTIENVSQANGQFAGFSSITGSFTETNAKFTVTKPVQGGTKTFEFDGNAK